jgi:VWFA-related protein
MLLALPCVAQTSQPQSKPSDSSAPTATFRSFTRLVTIEVVAKDRHGRHVTGLKPSDFEIYEQSLRGKEKRPQKIVGFDEIHFADLAKQSPTEMKVPAGVYTNAVTLTRNPVPPTIIMVDGLNSDIKDQAQIQVQLDKIIKSIPRNTPVAIFLLGWRLRILQDFSTDPELLKVALKQASSSASAGLVTGDPLDNPNEASAQLENLQGHESDITGGAAAAGPSATASGGSSPAAGTASQAQAAQSAINAQIQALADAAQGIEQSEYKATMDHRVSETLQALIAIGHYVAGYPGRKNLLWISGAFPFELNGYMLQTDKLQDDKGYASYGAQIRRAANALSDAKIAVYPVNPAGVQPHAIYGADARPRNYSGPGMAATMAREIGNLGAQDLTMHVIADDTGGAVCNGTNDVSECLTRAFDDSSSFYEISYYPDSHDWNGEYRKIIVHTKRSGVELEYRHGYFAGPAPYENQKAELQDAACQGYLSSTSVVFAATKLPVQASGELRFYMDVDPETITLSPTGDGGREFSIQVAACTFDKKGKPLQLLSQSISGKLTPKEYDSVAKNGLAHIMAIPAPLPAGVSLVVKDLPSGHVGSVHVNLENVMVAKKAEENASATTKKSD